MIDADSKFSGDIVRLGIDVLLQNTGRVVVAYSGGADSSLLLVLLQHYLDGSGITLEAAHLNHMIRGD